MSTIQIVGIAVAAVIVVLLVVALLVTRKGGGAGEAGEAAEHASFLDSPPSDTLSKLGAPEHASPADAATVEAAPAPPPEVVRTSTGVASAAREGLGLDWDRAKAAPNMEPLPVPDESETTGEMPAVAKAESETPAVEPTEPEAPPVSGSAEEPPAEPEASAASDRLIPLSSIIVTTSTKMVDLEDPEIRRMLTELVTFELDQATQFREQGQSIDAVLQLTEAEKICRALGKHDTAHEIRQMMRGLQD
jgi:hypothetical protein